MNWSKASDEAKQKYINLMTSKLNSVLVPACVECSDLQCEDHTEELEDYTMDILQAIETAAQECLPSSGGGGGGVRQHVVPGWAEHVKPFCEESKFWCAVWESSGKPSEGDLFELMMKCKSQYKHAVRRLKRANNSIQNRGVG